MATEHSQKIINELADLSVDIIRLCKVLDIPRSVSDQVIRSTTSIGANFSEAQDASSKKDFINKIYIAKKEASETKYWLLVIHKLVNDDQLPPLSERVQGFVMMLQKIINSSKSS